jgi:hypothetical protein
MFDQMREHLFRFVVVFEVTENFESWRTSKNIENWKSFSVDNKKKYRVSRRQNLLNSMKVCICFKFFSTDFIEFQELSKGFFFGSVGKERWNFWWFWTEIAEVMGWWIYDRNATLHTCNILILGGSFVLGVFVLHKSRKFRQYLSSYLSTFSRSSIVSKGTQEVRKTQNTNLNQKYIMSKIEEFFGE